MVSNGFDINTPAAELARPRPAAGCPSPGDTRSSPVAWQTSGSSGPVRSEYNRPGRRDRSTGPSDPGRPDVHTAPGGCRQHCKRPSAAARNTSLSLRGHPVLDQAARDAVNSWQLEAVRIRNTDLLAGEPAHVQHLFRVDGDRFA